jgi:hypothetical protein
MAGQLSQLSQLEALSFPYRLRRSLQRLVLQAAEANSLPNSIAVRSAPRALEVSPFDAGLMSGSWWLCRGSKAEQTHPRMNPAATDSTQALCMAAAVVRSEVAAAPGQSIITVAPPDRALGRWRAASPSWPLPSLRRASIHHPTPASEDDVTLRPFCWPLGPCNSPPRVGCAGYSGYCTCSQGVCSPQPELRRDR